MAAIPAAEDEPIGTICIPCEPTFGPVTPGGKVE